MCVTPLASVTFFKAPENLRRPEESDWASSDVTGEQLVFLPQWTEPHAVSQDESFLQEVAFARCFVTAMNNRLIELPM